MRRIHPPFTIPLVALLACSTDPLGARANEDEPDPTAQSPGHSDLELPRTAADEGRCESNDDCLDDENGPICFEGACVPCSPATNAGCLEGEYCSPERMDCLPGCDDINDCNGFLCTEGECTDYIETTPICNYLERGINDFSAGADWYALAPVNVRTLADIDRLAFGEDIPRDRCLDANPSFPCTDKDIHDDWCIEGLRLSMMGFTLFSAEADPSEGCLLNVNGGKSGMKQIDGDTLRASPSWGFDTSELLQLFSYVTFDAEGNIGVIPDGYTIEAEEIARLIEGTIGIEAAKYNKGEANNIYHDNKRGITIRPTRESKVDCDFGNCPNSLERLSSPWVELEKKDDTTISVDIDIEFENNTFDPGDTITVDFKKYYGNLGTSLGYGSLGFDVGVNCEPTNGSFAVQVEVTNPTFEVEGGVLLFAQELCGFGASFLGGSMVGIIGYETWCNDQVEKIDPANVIADKLGDSFSKDLLKNLDACPQVTISDDGSVSFDVVDTIDCSGLDCIGQPARVAPEVAFNYQTTTATFGTSQLVDVLQDIAAPPQDPLAAKEFSIETVDQGMVALCALQATCDADALDFGNIDFSLLQKVLDNLPEGNELPTPQDAPDFYAALDAFANQAEIQAHCVDQNNIVWLMEVWAAMTSEACADLPPFESLFPASMVKLEVDTLGPNVTDNYPFVDFVDPGRENWRALAGAACRHLYDKTYDPAPPSWQNCPDANDPAYFGQLGCPCADLDVFTIDDILVDGGRPDGAGSYRVHGHAGPGQFCDDDTATIGGHDVVCGLSKTHHAECQECGVDTNVGCACDDDNDCANLESGLTCVGDEDDGWSPGAKGTCLPDVGSIGGYESMSDMPWFCLESCGSINGDGQMGCLYDQSDDVELSHAQCVDVDGMADDPSAWSACAEAGMFWAENNTCTAECSTTNDCVNLGFPGNFVCDAEFGWTPGNCVPNGCQSMNIDDDVFEFCERYR